MSASRPEDAAVEVRHNIGEKRFEAEVGGHLSAAEYELEGATMVLTHTWVSPELRGKGIAEKLVRAAMEHARAKQFRVVPACSYVGVFLQRHPEFRDLVS